MDESKSDATTGPVAGSEEALKECNRLDSDLAALRVAYEHYFLGMERRPPKSMHEALRTKMHNLKFAPFVRGASARFRIQGLQSKLLAYERMWARTIYEMENGIYRRDVYKARLRAKQREEAMRLSRKDPAPLVVQPPPASPVLPPQALSDAKVKAIYDAYVSAKKRCDEDVSKISLPALAQSLRKQIPELIKQHKAKTVDFKIVIKDGKAVIKAVPK